jgi:hypothetical protein
MRNAMPLRAPIAITSFALYVLTERHVIESKIYHLMPFVLSMLMYSGVRKMNTFAGAISPNHSMPNIECICDLRRRGTVGLRMKRMKN